MKKSCLALILLTGLASAPADAGPFSIALDSPVQTGAAGSVLHFFGTITNTTGSTEYLNSDNFSLTGLNLATDVIDNFGSTPLSLASGASSGDIDLFDITIPNPFTDACVALLNCGGTYQIYGGADGNANSLLGTANFTVNIQQPSGVPEPSSFSMIALAGVLFAAFGRRTDKWTRRHPKVCRELFNNREAKIDTRLSRGGRVQKYSKFSFAMFVISLFQLPCMAQSASPDASTQAAVPQKGSYSEPLPRFGVGISAGLLGLGIEADTALTQHSNLRIGFNGFEYSLSTNKDGIRYDGDISLRSVAAFYDYYLGPFHVSPGALLYNGNKVTATANVPGGQTFSLNGTTYYSSSAVPVTGNANVTFNKVSPGLLLGFGNLLPRSMRQWGVRFDIGAVYVGAPKATLNLAGSTCNSQISICQPIAGNAAIQSNIQAEQAKINHDIRIAKFYPVFSLSFGLKFR